MSGIAVLGMACSNVGEGIANQVLEDQGVEVDIDGDSVTIDTDEGTITAGSGVPEGFPDDFPLPAGAEVAGSVSGVGDFDVIASFQLPGDVAGGTEFYRQALPAAGYTITGELTGADRTNSIFDITGNGVTGQVILNPAGEQTQLAVTLDLTG